MSNFPLPSDNRLEQLIRDSFEFTAGPDMRRLNQLEERLARQATGIRTRKKLNTLPWWIVLLLAGGVATAAWWSAKVIFVDVSEHRQIENNIEKAPVVPQSEDLDIGSESERHDPAVEGDDRDSPVIYQREGF